MASGFLNKKLVPIYYDWDLIWRLPNDSFIDKTHSFVYALSDTVYACLIIFKTSIKYIQQLPGCLLTIDSFRTE